MDQDLVAEALELGAGVEAKPRREGWRDVQTPTEAMVRRFRLQVIAFLQDLPGSATLAELRDAIDATAPGGSKV